MTAFEALATPACVDLLAALAGTASAPDAATIERLRRAWPRDVVAAAVEVQWARTRAAAKFGDRAATLWLDREGAEMASGPRAAAWKARRYAGRTTVVDVCCGIGGDLMELARVAPCTGIELNPARAWMAAQNAGVRVACGDALAPGAHLADTWVHADPGRRANGRRLMSAADLLPPLADLCRAFRGAAGLGVKLGPGLDLAPGERAAGDEVEFIAERGVLTQQVLWAGGLALHPGCNTATHACSGLTLSGPPAATPCAGGGGDSGRWHGMIALPSPALERARLVHMVAAGACEPAPGIGILTADDIAPNPWLEVHRVIAQLPARTRTVAAWLRAHNGGVPVVRTRGKACDPDEWQAALRGDGAHVHTVWVLRLGRTQAALVTERVGGWPTG